MKINTYQRQGNSSRDKGKGSRHGTGSRHGLKERQSLKASKDSRKGLMTRAQAKFGKGSTQGETRAQGKAK
jgi:hypothetical protein